MSKSSNEDSTATLDPGPWIPFGGLSVALTIIASMHVGWPEKWEVFGAGATLTLCIWVWDVKASLTEVSN